MTEQNKTKVPAELIPAGDYPVVSTDAVMDKQKGKTQEEVNEQVDADVEALQQADTNLQEQITAEASRASAKENSLDNRLSTVEELAEISVEGGTIGIASSEDFTNRTPAGDAKIPTVGAIMGSVDEEPTPGSDNLVKSGGVQNELALGAVYDVSAKNPTAGPNNDGKFESLSALLSDANLITLIPTAVRKGGMSIKFVQTSDNKYVQFRLMSDEWSINTEDWAVADEDVYVENPEFVYIKTDKDDKILWAIKTDGSIYYGAGVPSQVIDYIQQKIDELSLDEYEDIVAFLNGLEKGDKTLQTLLDEKVDKVERKSLIDAGVADSNYVEDNPEYLNVITDAENKVVEGIKVDGTKEVNVRTVFRATIDVPNATIKTVDNPEYIRVITDTEGLVLFGIRKDGTVYIPVIENAQIQSAIDEFNEKLQEIGESIDEKLSLYDEIFGCFSIENNPEWIQVTVDETGKIIEGIKEDGTKFISNSNIEAGLNLKIAELNNTISKTKVELEEEIKDVSVPVFANDSELNVYRQVMQLYNLRWTPKLQIREGYSVRPAGVEVKGMPYSSVKEYLKYVGIDVSYHTFMTAVNDEHSLFYTEVPTTWGGSSRSAYGRTYYGVNSYCYFGSVCSGLVSTSLGFKVQLDSWAYQTIKDKCEVLDNQDVNNLRVGDIFSMPGHCGVCTKIVRNNDGTIKEWEIAEHSAPIRIGDNHTHKTLTDRTWASNIIWCRYKQLYKNTNYRHNPFVLADDEYLFDSGDFVFVDSVSERTYYRCKESNRGTAVSTSDWEEVYKWDSNTAYTASPLTIRSYKDDLYRCKNNHTSDETFDESEWIKIKGAIEWCSYPYVYNDDICTFAGDRAAFHSNDLIYINYNKGAYTQMQLYKDGDLYKTYNLPSDGFQINVSEDCANAGMYKARLTDGTNYSKYTYFEVIDAQVSATYTNGVAEIVFSSTNGTPLAAQIVEHSGGSLCHKELNDTDITDGRIQFNPLARLYAERFANWNGFNHKTDLDLYARVIFEGEYGNVVNDMIYIGTVDAITGKIVYPNEPINLGTINGSENIILADRVSGAIYTVDFVAGIDADINILNAIGIITWETSLPVTLETNKRYHIKVDNGIGNVIIL